MKTEVKLRLKSKWKSLTIGILGVAAIIYFIVTGNEIDLSFLTDLLK